MIYKRFFQSLLDELREKYKFTNARVAQPQGWYSFTSGVSGFQYSIAFSAKGLQAEVYIDTGSMERNKAIFDWFHRQRDAIDSQMGEPLTWEPLEHRRASRICAVRPNTTFADAVAHEDVLRSWSIGRLLRLKGVFGPKLSEVLAATAPTPALETA